MRNIGFSFVGLEQFIKRCRNFGKILASVLPEGFKHATALGVDPVSSLVLNLFENQVNSLVPNYQYPQMRLKCASTGTTKIIHVNW